LHRLKEYWKSLKIASSSNAKQIAGGFGKNIKMFNILIIAC